MSAKYGRSFCTIDPNSIPRRLVQYEIQFSVCINNSPRRGNHHNDRAKRRGWRAIYFGRDAAKRSDLLTWGAQHLIGNITSKKFVHAIRPTCLCSSPKTTIRVKVSYYPGVLRAQQLKNVWAKKRKPYRGMTRCGTVSRSVSRASPVRLDPTLATRLQHMNIIYQHTVGQVPRQVMFDYETNAGNSL